MLILRHLPVHTSRPVALTIGNFDGVHLGHRAMIDRTREAARRLGVACCVMTFEPHPREFFAPDQAPTRLTSLREKLEVLRGLGVDCTLVCRFDYDFARTGAEEFIERILVQGLGVRWVLVGDDFRFGARRQGDYNVLAAAGRERGFEVARMPTVAVDAVRVSSTAVRERLAAGELQAAARLLGRPYSISGRVVRGDGIGRQLGFATANVRMRHNRPPLNGIFVVEVLGLGERPLPGVASLGVRPTVTDGGPAVLEVHLLDFEREIYGAHLTVRFLHKLRDEEKYPDLATLTRAIARDVENARGFFHDRGERARVQPSPRPASPRLQDTKPSAA
jgi:riboflavin kinase/FMN adenylyltransferase